MIGESPAGEPPPVLVIGLGNMLLRDDGVGLVLLEKLRADVADDPRVGLLDGGTQGLALLPHLAGRRALLLLDAVALGAAPGTVHVLPDARPHAGTRGATAHEANASELLLAATLVGDCPPTVALVGVEPAEVSTGIGLSAVVRRTVPEADRLARRFLDDMLVGVAAASCPP